MEITGILEELEERYPLLLVDRLLEREIGVRAVGLKNVTINEDFFRGHFPGHPVMPGVLILEALAQVGKLALGPEASAAVRVGGIESARFRRPVVPGDCLRLEVAAEPREEGGYWLRGVAFVGECVAAEATLRAVPAS